MIVIMGANSTEEDIQSVQARLVDHGMQAQMNRGVERTVIGVIGQTYPDLKDELERLSGVAEVVLITKPYKLASREFHPDQTIIRVGDVTLGGDQLVVMAGPCAVESEAQVLSTARAVKNAGANILRGGAFKPRTSPYSFQGMGIPGLRLLAEARDETGLPIVTEVMNVEDVETVAQYADILQIGARNMQNFNLLGVVGQLRQPILLKRGFSNTYEEWLLAAEYILANGNSEVILCERGIRTFETFTRNTFDLNAIPTIQRLSHLPIVADPSHSTGQWYLVSSVALGAVAAGAHGIIVDVHPAPGEAKCDGSQSLTFDNFEKLMESVRLVAQAVGKVTIRP